MDVVRRRQALAERLPTWTPRTLAGLLDDAAARWSDRPLLITESHRFTYRQVSDWSADLAGGLAAAGLQAGEHVAVVMANFAEFVALKFAIARIGAVMVPVNFNLRGHELLYVLEQSDAAMLVCMDRFRGHDYGADLDAVAPGWRTGQAAALPRLRFAAVLETARSGVPDALPLRGNPMAIDKASPGDVSDILYTSGTTGRPKGVLLTHDMVLRSGYSSAYHRAFEDGRRIGHVLPMYHVFGYVECLIASMFVGGAVILQLQFEAEAFLALIEENAATDIVCLPTMTMKLIDVIRARGFDSSALTSVFNSGGINPTWVWDEIRTRFRVAEVVTAYGMSESTASTTCTLPEGDHAHLVTSNGRLKLAGAAGEGGPDGLVALYKAIDPVSGADLPPGEVGELVVRGPVVTAGYYRKPAETAAAFTPDGWLRTGDLGRVDADGYLTLTGRLKETYRCGGEMVTPREIELVLEEHPAVLQALAVGIPDVRMGEVGCACIVPAPTAVLDPDELLALCRARLARYKVPRHILVIAAEDVPLSVTGRPQKHLLADLARHRLAEAAERTATRVA